MMLSSSETAGLRLVPAILLAAAFAAAGAVGAEPLTVDGETVYMHGRHQYDSVEVVNGGRIVVDAHAGGEPTPDGTGNLELIAPYIYIDATSSIDADGAGYQSLRCGDGTGPTGSAGGIGGCAVHDSGGGGAHFGIGGRGTKDFDHGLCGSPDPDPPFPYMFEEDCGNSLNGDGTSCTDDSDCRDCDGEPSVAGQPYFHSIWEVEFGASGGDKGCRDGDGFGLDIAMSGAGGGRIVLAGVDGSQTGQVVIEGAVRAMGWRGCGDGNDSAGGGAGGSILIVGDQVQLAAGARIWASGGVGGDTQKLDGDTHFDLYRGQQCPADAQDGGTCDDCGGGGGGGIISVLSRAGADIAAGVDFDVSGSIGGSCPICNGEAGGGAGELQISGGYLGEVCDGWDNDLDGETDEELGMITCSLGSCDADPIPACEDGAPNYCIPYDHPQCLEPDPDTRARFSLIVDTSGSMLTDLDGLYTFGDGSLEHPGHPDADDSRLYLAKNALADVIAGYPEIDWSLARFHQDQGIDRSCQLAKWFECEDICCTYDNPQGNQGTQICTVDVGGASNVAVNEESPAGEQCINYAGNCGSQGDGADILVGFDSSLNQLMMWIDHEQSDFVDDTTIADYCDFDGGGDCELRGTGPTPLADSLLTHYSYLGAVKQTDPFVTPYFSYDCRTYAVILLTDGTETCDGDPVAAAESLLDDLNIETYVIGFSVLAEEEAALDEIANAGSASGTRPAYLVGNEDELASALAEIVGDAVMYELCNGDDDDCDGEIDEDWPELGDPCTDGELGVCQGSGYYACSGDETGVVCQITDPGESPSEEECNGLDDDCDGLVDEELQCDPCVPTGQDICDGLDNDCDGETDEDFVSAECGWAEVGHCSPGATECQDGVVVCEGGQGPIDETCNNEDDDCDGVTDGMVEACYPEGEDGCEASGDPPSWSCEGQCQVGSAQCVAGEFGDCVGAVIPVGETCNGLDDDCDGFTDETFPELGQSCGQSDLGVCELGAYACDLGGLTCEGAVYGTANEFNPPQLCNGLDDDCDGFTDEDAVEAPCGNDLGICEAGTMTCHEVSPGVWEYECVGEVEGTDESCDGLDNDCDGETDEDLFSGVTCSESQTDDPDEGECEEGVLVCLGGEWVCNATGPTEELCDGKDNDCDGLTDEDTFIECPGGLCIEGECAPECSGDEMSCPNGMVCEDVNGEDVCIPDVCTEWSEDHLPCTDNPYWCDEGFVPPCHCEPLPGLCVDDCYGVECPEGAVCIPQAGGQCLTETEYGCYAGGCGDGQICSGGECVDDPCAGADCAGDEYCNADGECVSPCDDIECPSGWGCVEGECVEDPCAGVQCPSGQSCEDGECVQGACWGVVCEFYETCVEGECVEDPCWNVECPNSFYCQDGACYAGDYEPGGGGDEDTDSGGGDTGADTETGGGTGPAQDAGASSPGITSVLGTGSGGCLCNAGVGAGTTGPGGGRSALLLALLLAGAWLVRRASRSLVPIALLAGAVLALAGCRVEPYDFRTADGGDTGADGDADADADSDADTDADSDTGTASDTSECDFDAGDNDCDGIDDDCDGETDEDVDTSDNPYHCGGCNNECDYDHAEGICDGGVCQMGECNTFAQDLDSDTSNGCEYVCQPIAEYDLCNGIDFQDTDNPYEPVDDDCDGQFDEDVGFDTDPYNCGWCGHHCDFDHAESSCQGGACVMGQCQQDYWDIDEDPENGCEYHCAPDTDPTEICDGSDNDCDGSTDESHGDPDELGAPCYTAESGCSGDPLVCEGICQPGVVSCVEGQVVCAGQVQPEAAETCNGLDDDCDGSSDEGLLGTLEHCTGCYEPCEFDHASAQCVEQECQVLACDFGWVNLDPEVPGCEYECTPNGSEICDGLDNDCDGLTDLDDGDLFVPDSFCRQQGPCAGVEPQCMEKCGQVAWFCDYDTQLVEVTDECEPNAVVLEEAFCDGVDGDCDGVTDESFPLVGQPCTEVVDPEHPYGACLSRGHYVCDASEQDVICEITEPGQQPLTEKCNGVDDDCDGEVDEGEVDEMVHVDHSGLDFYIYAYEASRIDATAADAGNATARACSKPGVVPWYSVPFDLAAQACAAAGKRLCSAEEWAAACAGSDGSLFPYGDAYQPDTCNGLDYAGETDEVRPTGELTGCQSADGAFDLSGNLREWTSEEPQTDIYVVRGGSYNTPRVGLSCDFSMSRASGDAVLPAIGFRCCADP
ncbi:MAG: MopE-related protein [Polyangia bacterium]